MCPIFWDTWDTNLGYPTVPDFGCGSWDTRWDTSRDTCDDLLRLRVYLHADLFAPLLDVAPVVDPIPRPGRVAVSLRHLLDRELFDEPVECAVDGVARADPELRADLGRPEVAFGLPLRQRLAVHEVVDVLLRGGVRGVQICEGLGLGLPLRGRGFGWDTRGGRKWDTRWDTRWDTCGY